MDFTFGEQEERLRGEVREFLRQHLPQLDPHDRVGSIGNLVVTQDGFEKATAFNKELAGRHWMAPAWPREYGGLGATIHEQMVFNEEFGYVRPPDNGTRAIGVSLLGPTLIVHGTEEQRRKHLRGITSAETVWCQGFSEPEAGSDLASLQTRAVRDGDEYVINGQKTWTSEAHHADWMFLLARTDADAPKHKGISFLMVDMATPGITVRPMVHLADRHHFNEVFLDNVRVPASNMVGAENEGWYVAMTLLDFERSGIYGVSSLRRTMEVLVESVAGALGRSRYRPPLADLAVSLNAARCMSYRIGDMQAKGAAPTYDASAMKVFTSELQQRMYQFGTSVLGVRGQLVTADPAAPYEGELAVGYLTSMAATIYAGSSEIQRNIIATRGLGLPRG
jgi:alkylation response protein AidB-like acyl-CoA dehydrogenase